MRSCTIKKSVTRPKGHFCKGHKISKANYLVLISSKKRTKSCLNSAQAFKAELSSYFFGRYENT